MTTTPQAALLSDASKLSNEFQPTMHIDVLISWGNDAVAELRRLDALVAHLTADRDDTANELALRTKYNMALARERDRLLAKLQATQACHVPDARKMIGTQADHDFDKMRENGATAWAGVDAQALRAGHLTQQVEPVQAGELPDEREAFERWWRQRQLLTFPKDYDQGRLDGWGSAYKPAAMEAWQAALSARKPLTDKDAEQLHDGNWYWVSYAGLHKTYRAAALYKANVDCFYSFEFSGIPAREVQVHSFVGIGLEVKP